MVRKKDRYTAALNEVKYHFTDAEKFELGHNLAMKLKELSDLKATKKSVMKDLKENFDKVEEEISNLARGLRDGYEWRDQGNLPFGEISEVK